MSAAWRGLLRPGDVLVCALALAVVIGSARLLWQDDAAREAVVHAQGSEVARLPLATPTILTVSGPLGLTRIEIEPGRARVASDPGPRQYCVRQGWLSRPGAVAICAPNEVSLRLEGSRQHHDSLVY